MTSNPNPTPDPARVSGGMRIPRLGLAALLIALVPALLGASSAAAAIQVKPVEGGPVTLDLGAMPAPADVSGQVYTLRSEAGERQVTVTGWSLAAVMDAAGVDPIFVGYLEIARPGGGSLLLSRRQATDPGAFPEGPPVVYQDDSGIYLLRPSAGPGDFNEPDLIALPPGSTLSVTARSGTLVQVRAKASKRRLKVGEQVAFSAILDRAGAGEGVEFSWYFDDGTSAKGAAVTHRFRKAGIYDVVVGVTTPGDRVGASATVTVKVGEPSKQGPKRRGGGTNREENAPDSGASEGASGPGSSGSGGGPYNPGVGTDFGSPPPDPGYSPPRPSTVEPPAEPEPRPARREPRGDEIEGELLADTDIAEVPLSAVVPEPEPPSETERSVAARTGSEDPVGGGMGVPGAALGIGVALAMLGLGGVLEARGIGRLRW